MRLSKMGTLLGVAAALLLAACQTQKYPNVRGHVIGEDGNTALELLRKANLRTRVAWDGSLVLGEGQDKDCNKLFDLGGQSVACESIRLQFTFPLESPTGSSSPSNSELYSIEYFQRPEKPIDSTTWLKKIQDHFGEMVEVKLQHNQVQELESRRYVRVLSGPYAPNEMDILEEGSLATKEKEKGCRRPVAMVRLAENRRDGMTLSYSIEVMDVQRLCKRIAAIDQIRAKQGGPTDQLKFNKP